MTTEWTSDEDKIVLEMQKEDKKHQRTVKSILGERFSRIWRKANLETLLSTVMISSARTCRATWLIGFIAALKLLL